MTKKILMSMTLLLTLCFSFVSCSEDKDDPQTPKTSAKINLELPINIQAKDFKNALVLLTNKATKVVYSVKEFSKTEKGYTAEIKDIPVGTYSVLAHGILTYEAGGKEVSIEVNTINENVQITENSSNQINLLLNVSTGKEGFVISEIFFRGTQTPNGKAYFADQYIKITNNTSKLMYADSLVIMESAFTNGVKHKYIKDYRNEGFAAGAIYMIPGKGKDVPVKPGETLLLALNGKNHKSVNANSFDLSNANFEFYDVSTNNYKDEQNANVKDLERIFTTSASILVLNMRGNKAYAIGKIQGTIKDFLKNNYYEAQYNNDVNGKLMTQKAYFLPSAWIIDAVNVDMKDNPHDWNIIPVSMDNGFTYCSDNAKDKSGIGTAVVRKMKNGKYVDTNNSSEDFTPKATPTVK
ncbi:hypothetical protein HMPREF0653_02606 [Prevotella disiens JCM 6334 = ATCC 29426]|uniref:DUF4876 domain-containing protein n=2 Tax=Prevotella disiens TaxID=28130 RepID=A0A379DZV1_9BACT|nr:DUF4876 domain-containing protein [Prevotella disiens]ERJ71034.1 hypothetical protein HMPREF0653_02606 [Prevotella disiens JCM 6334 = ATCC 29426]SUB85859.1 Uncharacterised protein [Prevotella disiens]